MVNVKCAAELAWKAAWMGANVVVLPEFFLTFYRPAGPFNSTSIRFASKYRDRKPR